MTYRIQVRPAHVIGTWFWRIVARNGQTILTSRDYANRGQALRAARTFLENNYFTLDRKKTYEWEVD